VAVEVGDLASADIGEPIRRSGRKLFNSAHYVSDGSAQLSGTSPATVVRYISRRCPW
jgi:hypothetical protein